jgi:hydrogenase maturation protease
VRIAVIGIGNVLAGDDAVGPHVVRVLEARYELPEAVQVIDAGTPGYDLTAFLVGLDAVVLVDAVRARGAAGEVRLYDKAALLEKKPILAVSPHEPGVREALLNADFMGVTPTVVRLVGVIPGATATGIGLTAEVRAALPAAVEAVGRELAALGVALRERVPPREPDLWWERRAGA